MRYAIGIDLGGTNIAAGVVDEQYHLLDTLSVPTLAERPWEQVAADMAGCVKSLVKKASRTAWVLASVCRAPSTAEKGK